MCNIPKLEELETKSEYLAAFTYMWQWLSQETLKRGYKVKKHTFFKEHNIKNIPEAGCYLCEYVLNKGNGCKECPVYWNRGKCLFGEYGQWANCDTNDYKKAAKIAEKISKLDEK